jgi:hypothetical protein
MRPPLSGVKRMGVRVSQKMAPSMLSVKKIARPETFSKNNETQFSDLTCGRLDIILIYIHLDNSIIQVRFLTIQPHFPVLFAFLFA